MTPDRFVLRLLCFLLLSLPLRAQRPQGVFLTDTIEVGQPFQYALSVRHRVGVDVLFPDTARAFAPFLVRDITIFSTQTDAKGSLDSAVYTLVSFEITPTQTLRVPLFILRNPADCTAIYSNIDTVRLRESIQSQRLDTLRLSTSTQVSALRQQMNYPLLLSILAGLFLLAGVVLVFFRRPIRRRIERYRLYRQHLDFQRAFNRLTRNIDPESAPRYAGRAVVLWKEYMEWLEHKPFTSLTTREIEDSVHDNRLFDALKEIDGVIYGSVYSDKTQLSLRVLQEVADNSYQHRIEQLLEIGRNP